MLPKSILSDIPGGKALLEWFGRTPSFHDAELLELMFSSKGAGMLRIHAWNMTDQVDAEGYFVLDKHAVVTFTLEGVSAVNCVDFDLVPGILFNLEISKVDDQIRIEWSASYGVAGSVTCKQMLIDLMPGKPE